MIVAISGIKGGVGKSTVAVNLVVSAAAAGYVPALVDSDPQGTAMMWAAARGSNSLARQDVATMALRGEHIGKELRRLEKVFGIVFVDGAARDSDTQRATLEAAHLVLLPLPPRGFDLWTLEAQAAVLRGARVRNPELRAVAFLNKADPAGQDNAEAEQAIADFASDMTLAPCRIGNRKAIASGAMAGLAAREMPRPDRQAVAELQALWRTLCDTVNIPL